MNPEYTFKFLSYYLDPRTLTATFCYQGIDNFIFTERVHFVATNRQFNPHGDPDLSALLDRALFLSFILIGTSYYKTHPTPSVRLDQPLDPFQAAFFTSVYQEGLSQFAFENQLTRAHLARFNPTTGHIPPAPISYDGQGIIALASGGKDSLLTSTLLLEHRLDFTPWYLSSSIDRDHPAVIDHLFDEITAARPAHIAVRELDLKHLGQKGQLNGHIPITYIVSSLALVQAILNHQNIVLTSIGQEGTEPHSYLGDLPVNHQWSKTWPAEQMFAQYIARYLSPQIFLGSPLRSLSELAIAEQFIKKCWQRYGYSFSSCNTANYRQKAKNQSLSWCGNCAKCANLYLLFCPFLPSKSLKSLFADQDLFAKPSLEDTFKGLLGVDQVPKPFECVGSINELRTAYHLRQSDYTPLPFVVPEGNFDYHALGQSQPFISALFRPR